MSNKIKSLILTLVVVMCIGISVDAITEKTGMPLEFTQQNKIETQDDIEYIQVNPLVIVNNPSAYLNKNVKIKAKFNKFSMLGLDYAPAMKSSEEYISFLIQRPDVKNHVIPLSELKLFLKRTEAEKHIDLESGDEVEFSGKVFSKALGDAWIDVDNFVVLTVKPKNDKN